PGHAPLLRTLRRRPPGMLLPRLAVRYGGALPAHPGLGGRIAAAGRQNRGQDVSLPRRRRLRLGLPGRSLREDVRAAGSPAIATTIDFMLPNLRYELVTCGSYWFSSRATVTAITEQECRIDYCAAWNVFRWVPFATTLFRLVARHFLNQDKRIMERQALGLRYKPPLMLLDDADTPAKWYYKLKTAYLEARQSGRPMEHPIKEPVTLRWRS